jgi:hypothetical protein
VPAADIEKTPPQKGVPPRLTDEADTQKAFALRIICLARSADASVFAHTAVGFRQGKDFFRKV